MSTLLQGGCLCRAVRFTARHPGNPHTYSCEFCQKHTGALTAMWYEFAAADVCWTGEGGAPATWRSSDTSSRAFCPRCGSSLGAIDDAPTVALLAGCFDRLAGQEMAPQAHGFSDRLPAWWPQPPLMPIATAIPLPD